MWLTIVASVYITMVLLLITVLIYAVAQKKNRRRTKAKEEFALNGVADGISDRLHNACRDSKWRWVCYPAGFAIDGGIARIEVLYPSGEQHFMDVCLAANGYMALHMLNVSELPAAKTGSIPPDSAETPISAAAPKAGAKPCDEESVGKWYNIVFIDTLTTLIGDLNAEGELCLHIGMDGKAYVEKDVGITVIYEFGEMPDVTLWGHITDKLGEEGLFAEVRDGNCIFISWDCTEITD